MRSVVAGFFDVAHHGFVAGRSAARLQGLDGFSGGEVELLVPRTHRRIRSSGTVRSTVHEIGKADIHNIGCMRVVRAERLILDSIDSAIRKKLVSEHRPRSKVIERHRLRGMRVLTFTYEDIRDRPRWVIDRLREALGCTALAPVVPA